MAEHLSDQEIELISKHELRGANFVKALLHIEMCDECSKRLPVPTKTEIIGWFLPDDSTEDMESVNNNSEETRQQKDDKNN